MQKILVVLEGREQAPLLAEKALELAKIFNAAPHFYKRSYDSIDDINRYFKFDNFEELKTRIVEDDEQWLSGFVDNLNKRGLTATHRVQWSRRLYEGVLAEAENSACDLILKAANVHSRLREIVHTPDDWRIMREAGCPVMLVRPEEVATGILPSATLVHPCTSAAGGPVVAAINPLEDEPEHHELHIRVLNQASALAKGLQTQLVVAVGIPPLNYNVPYFVGLGAQYPELQNSLRGNAKASLDTLLKENSIAVDDVVILDGYAERVIEEICDEKKARLLVIGTVANKGVAGVFLGNTAERVLHHVNQDVLVVN